MYPADRDGSVAGAIILKMAYGYTVEPHNPDPLVDIADRGLDEFTSAIVPGAWLVDSIPARLYFSSPRTSQNRNQC